MILFVFTASQVTEREQTKTLTFLEEKEKCISRGEACSGFDDIRCCDHDYVHCLWSHETFICYEPECINYDDFCQNPEDDRCCNDSDGISCRWDDHKNRFVCKV